MTYGALDIGGTKTIVALADGEGKFLDKITFDTGKISAEDHFDKCLGILRDIVNKTSSPYPERIGLSLPALVDKDRKVMTNAFYAGWQGINVVDLVENKTGAKAIIDNDVNTCAFGEMVFGCGKEYGDFVWVTVSTGIGGAVVIDGKVVSGSNGCAGEFGHIKVEKDSPMECSCGQYGCLEAQASGTAITKYTLQSCEKDASFRKEFEKRGLDINAASCSILAGEGNITAKGIFEKAARYIGIGLSSVVNVINPKAVIFGGGVVRSFDLMEKIIKDTIVCNVTAPARNVEVLRTPLGYEASLKGALALAMK